MKNLKSLYAQVLGGITLGVVVGGFAPSLGVELKVLGDTFISLSAMPIGTSFLTTVVMGISHLEDMKKEGDHKCLL